MQDLAHLHGVSKIFYLNSSPCVYKLADTAPDETYVDDINRETFIIIQIERREALVSVALQAHSLGDSAYSPDNTQCETDEPRQYCSRARNQWLFRWTR